MKIYNLKQNERTFNKIKRVNAICVKDIDKNYFDIIDSSYSKINRLIIRILKIKIKNFIFIGDFYDIENYKSRKFIKQKQLDLLKGLDIYYIDDNRNLIHIKFYDFKNLLNFENKINNKSFIPHLKSILDDLISNTNTILSNLEKELQVYQTINVKK